MPAEESSRAKVPEFALVWRGAALGLVAVLAAVAGARAMGAAWWVRPLVPVFGAVAVLSGWAALIHLTGGEEFDDMPFV